VLHSPTSYGVPVRRIAARSSNEGVEDLRARSHSAYDTINYHSYSTSTITGCWGKRVTRLCLTSLFAGWATCSPVRLASLRITKHAHSFHTTLVRCL
jgi:hypothetical protein